MQTIKCDCGQEILVVPDLKQMKHAIRNHCRTCKAKPRSFPKLPEIKLTVQILNMAANHTFPTRQGGIA